MNALHVSLVLLWDGGYVRCCSPVPRHTVCSPAGRWRPLFRAHRKEQFSNEASVVFRKKGRGVPRKIPSLLQRGRKSQDIQPKNKHPGSVYMAVLPLLPSLCNQDLTCLRLSSVFFLFSSSLSLCWCCIFKVHVTKDQLTCTGPSSLLCQ